MAKEEPLPSVEGYAPVKKTVSLLTANILSIVFTLVPIAVGVVLIHYMVPDAHFNNLRFRVLIILLSLAVGIVVHELIHGITWLLVTHQTFRHLHFGFMIGNPYCHIDTPMSKLGYVAGALMPLFLLGVLPYVLSIFAGSYLWMLIGSIFIGTAAGDILIVWAIRKEPSSTLVYDHPSEAGCYIYHPIEEQ